MKQHPSSSFEGQVTILLPSLRRYARSLTRSDAESDDLVQDCVEKMLTRRGQWRGDNLRGWALTIMTNLYRNMLRSSAYRTTVDLDGVEELPAEQRYNDPLEHKNLHAALNDLAPENRAVLMLVVVEGYSYREVAEMLDIPVGTVMSRLSRARQSMAGQIAADNVVALRRSQ